MECPSCHRETAEGRFCERCGAPLEGATEAAPRGCADGGGTPSLPDFETLLEARLRQAEERIRATEARVERETAKIDRHANATGEPTLEQDRTCSLFEDMQGFVRFRFNPPDGGSLVENIAVEFANAAQSQPLVHQIRHTARPVEFAVQFPSQAVGLQSWNVRLSYQSSRRKHNLAGQIQLIVQPVASRGRAAGSYHINFNTTVGSVGHASDVNVHASGAEGLSDLLKQNDPFDEMRRIERSNERDWAEISFSDDNAVVDLPAMPYEAKTDRIVLECGGRRIHFFANGSISFGRNRDENDIALRNPDPSVVDKNDPRNAPYARVSRRHCLFESAGAVVRLTDGSRGTSGLITPSTNGTFWNGESLREPLELKEGEAGIVFFCGIHQGDNLSMDLKVCTPSRACATCPHANTHWCGAGKHPSLLLSRRDGVREKYVGLWSCFWMGDADPAFEGVVVFRKDGAFAYRDGARSGWLAPGTTIQSDFGTIGVSAPADANR